MGNAEDKLGVERAALEALAFKLIAQRSKVRLELGLTFIRLKATLKRGRWESYYAETFGEYEISLRTAQRWMDLAHAHTQNDRLAPFKPATDPQALEVHGATALAEAEVGQRPKGKVRLDGIFRLPLALTIDEQEATRELVNSPDWSQAQREIVALLKQLHIKFGIVNSGDNGLGREDRDGARGAM